MILIPIRLKPILLLVDKYIARSATKLLNNENSITGVKSKPEKRFPRIILDSDTISAENKFIFIKISSTNTFAIPILKNGTGFGKKFSRTKKITAITENADKIKGLLCFI